MTARVYWHHNGQWLIGPVTTEQAACGDSIAQNLYNTPNPAGQLWERVAERAS